MGLQEIRDQQVQQELRAILVLLVQLDLNVRVQQEVQDRLDLMDRQVQLVQLAQKAKLATLGLLDQQVQLVLNVRVQPVQPDLRVAVVLEVVTDQGDVRGPRDAEVVPDLKVVVDRKVLPGQLVRVSKG